jgi:hypothetical protein
VPYFVRIGKSLINLNNVEEISASPTDPLPHRLHVTFKSGGDLFVKDEAECAKLVLLAERAGTAAEAALTRGLERRAVSVMGTTREQALHGCDRNGNGEAPVSERS